MFKRLNKALIDAANDKVYNTFLAILVIMMAAALYFESSFLFILAIFIAAINLGLIYRFYLLRKQDENNK